MIRRFENRDLPALQRIHAANGLPENCFPDLYVDDGGKLVDNPLFQIKAIVEHDGQPMLASFVKLTSEVFLLVNHDVGTPEERWEALKSFTEYVKHEAFKLGLDVLTCWVPPEIEEAFGKRLKDLGFAKSPFQSYSMLL